MGELSKEYFLIPNAGKMVRDPQTLVFLPAEGDTKPRNTYWNRRIRFGDVTEGKPAAKVVELKPDSKKGKK